mmetsp:Transcript_46894/g.111657  ORF Transcript_46894/g.111657 Transcript_46894/m.111657 type:complete len:340 (-) Transcript_46894:200-1219(-)
MLRAQRSEVEGCLACLGVSVLLSVILASRISYRLGVAAAGYAEYLERWDPPPTPEPEPEPVPVPFMQPREPDDEELSDEQRSIMCFLERSFASRLRNRSSMPTQLVDAATKSCAVVSSSGAMLSHYFGKEIDAHDIVIRFNSAPVEGYIEHVGHKTTLRTGWSFGSFSADNASFKGGKDYFPSHDSMATFLKNLYPDQLGYGSKTANPTTGFEGMIMALANCRSVDGYEMAPSLRGRWSSYSYFSKLNRQTKADGDGNPWHAFFQSEHELWTRLSLPSGGNLNDTGRSHMIGTQWVDCSGNMTDPGPLMVDPRWRKKEKKDLAKEKDKPKPSHNNNVDV